MEGDTSEAFCGGFALGSRIILPLYEAYTLMAYMLHGTRSEAAVRRKHGMQAALITNKGLVNIKIEESN